MESVHRRREQDPIRAKFLELWCNNSFHVSSPTSDRLQASILRAANPTNVPIRTNAISRLQIPFLHLDRTLTTAMHNPKEVACLMTRKILRVLNKSTVNYQLSTICPSDSYWHPTTLILGWAARRTMSWNPKLEQFGISK